jgi:putative transcriptional regulator
VASDVPSDGSAATASYLGQLLVATPVIDEPVFRRTVILVVDHDGDGTLGVVLNRPSGTGVREQFALLAGETAEPSVLFEGGPVQPELTVALSAATGPGLCAWTVVDARAPHVPPAPVRLFRGYAGWSPGQLAREVAAGAWWVLSPRAADVFGPTPDSLWRDILRRQGAPMSFASTWLTDAKYN